MNDSAAPREPAILQGDHQNFGQALLAAARQFADCEAFVSGAERLTYAQWARLAQGLAALLVERGVKPGDRVAIILPSSIDYAICSAATLLIGAVASGVNTRLGPREVQAILAKSSPRLAITEDAFVLPPMGAATPQLRRGELAAGYERETAGVDPANVSADAPACIVWTSGTTGLPKGAWFDHRNLKAAVATAGVMVAPFDRCLLPLPFAHAGYMAKQWQQVAFGVTYILTPPVWSAAEMLRLIVQERVTASFGVPTQWAKLLELPELAEADFSALRICATGSAPMPAEVVEAITRRLGCPMIVRYAMTESPSVSGTRIGDDPQVLYRTVGRPQEGIELQVVDASSRPVRPGESGRIRLRGATVMRGYWNDDEASARAIDPDGWLLTDDMGCLDQQGNLVLLGRVSDTYNRGGYKVYPLEVEMVLEEHPRVARAAVLGKSAPVIGEIGVAFIVPADPAAPPTPEELRDWCRAALADYKTPDVFELIAELPLTPMLKTDKQALRARLA